MLKHKQDRINKILMKRIGAQIGGKEPRQSHAHKHEGQKHSHVHGHDHSLGHSNTLAE